MAIKCLTSFMMVTPDDKLGTLGEHFHMSYREVRRRELCMSYVMFSTEVWTGLDVSNCMQGMQGMYI